MGRSWNWRLISFHLMVCVVCRVRPCPLYRVISWLSKHIHFIQAPAKVSLWDPLFFHSPPFFCLPFFDSRVEACIQMSASLVSSLHSSLCPLSSHLFLLCELEEGSEAGMFSFVFDFWDSQEIGYKPLMLKSEGATPPPPLKKNNALFVECTHRLQRPNVPNVCVQQGDPSGCRLCEAWNVGS